MVPHYRGDAQGVRMFHLDELPRCDLTATVSNMIAAFGSCAASATRTAYPDRAGVAWAKPLL